MCGSAVRWGGAAPLSSGLPRPPSSMQGGGHRNCACIQHVWVLVVGMSAGPLTSPVQAQFVCASQPDFMIAAVDYVKTVCTQVNDPVVNGRGIYPPTCHSPVCARAAHVVWAACSPWLQQPAQAWLAGFAQQLQAFVLRCDSAASNPNTALLVNKLDLPNACGWTVVDGKDEARGTWNDGMKLSAPQGLTPQVSVEALFLPTGDAAVSLIVYDGSNADAPILQRLQGSVLPRGPINGTGSDLYLQLLSDAGSDKELLAVSLQVQCACSSDINCGGRGHCMSQRCRCDSGFIGAGCELVDPCTSSPCGGHGNCSATLNGGGAFRCTCEPGRSGVSCENAYSLTSFIVSGTSNPSLRGTYAQTAHVCSGKPVYQLGGDGGPVLYFASNWRVGPSGVISNCNLATFYLDTYHANPGCNDSPDGRGCAKQWLERNVADCVKPQSNGWCSAPNVTVTTTDARGCEEPVCGEHGAACHVLAEAGHWCTCDAGWRGDDCLEAIPSMIVTGTVNASYSGVYEPTTMLCGRAKFVVYQKGGPGGMVLWSASYSGGSVDSRWVVTGSLIREAIWANHPDEFVCHAGAAGESDYYLLLTKLRTPSATPAEGALACPSQSDPCAENNVPDCAHPRTDRCDGKGGSCTWCEIPTITVVASGR
eukprot:COSAG01_NODE_9456_length_2442_cov_3.740930_2_plen_649_part_00